MKRFFLFAFVLLLCGGEVSADTATCTPPPTCGDNQASKWTGTGWACVDLGAGSLDIQLVVQSMCSRAHGTESFSATCPSGYKLLSCSGSHGDMESDGEGWRVLPDVASNRCIALISEPRCHDEFAAYLIASCYK